MIIAIISDYDLAQQPQYDQAYEILKELAQNAITEESSTTVTLPSTGNDQPMEAYRGYASDLEGLDWPRRELRDSSASTSNSTAYFDASSSWNPTSEECLSERFEALEIPKEVNIATLDEQGKIAELQLIFPTLSNLDIKLTLQKQKGDFTKTCEHLLDIQYLEENGLRLKGIDSAFRLDEPTTFKGKLISTIHCEWSRLTTILIVGRAENRKDKNGKNRLDVSYKLTPVDLSTNDTNETVTSPSTSTRTLLARTASLPRINPTSSSSNGSTKAPSSAPDSPALKPSTQWRTVKRKTRSEATPSSSSQPSTPNQPDMVSSTFEAAHTAWRRGKSDVLYRPVAAVYSERARTLLAQRKAENSGSWDDFVSAQSPNNGAKIIDLHGLPVADGVRIALQRTQAWWDALGEDRVRKAREDGFVVVTGLGKHTSSGVSRLRQDVGAALKRGGWSVSVGTGQFVVHGRK